MGYIAPGCTGKTPRGTGRWPPCLNRFRTVVAVALLTVATYATAVEMRGDHPDTYVVQAGRHPLGHRRPLPEAAVAVAGDLAGQPADQEPAPDLSGRRDQPGLPGPRRGPAGPARGRADQRRPAVGGRAVPEGPARGRRASTSCPTWSALEEDRLRSSQGQVAYVKRPGRCRSPASATPWSARPMRYTRLDRVACCDIFHKDDLDFRGAAPLDSAELLDQRRAGRRQRQRAARLRADAAHHRHRHPRRSRRHRGQHPAAATTRAAKSASATA